jgi:hypothetical protein
VGREYRVRSGHGSSDSAEEIPGLKIAPRRGKCEAEDEGWGRTGSMAQICETR